MKVELKKTQVFIGIGVLVLLGLGLFFGSASEKSTVNESSQNLLNSLPDKVGGTDSSERATGLNVGDTAPSFEVTTLEGETVNLEALKSDEQPAVLYFFATWCPHCRADLDRLRDILPDYEGEIRFIAINMDNESDDAVRAWIEQRGYQAIEFAQFNLDTVRAFDVRSTTVRYVLSNENVIKQKGSGELTPQKWRELLDQAIEAQNL